MLSYSSGFSPAIRVSTSSAFVPRYPARYRTVHRRSLLSRLAAWIGA